MNQEINNLDREDDVNAEAAHPQPNQAAERNQVLDRVAEDADRLQQQQAIRAREPIHKTRLEQHNNKATNKSKAAAT